MDPVTMMVASIGIQFFNNYANNEKNDEIQAKQREFQKACQNHEFERMRKLQIEASKLALELEDELHADRIKDIENSYDVWLQNLAHSFTINNWPLNVLPFIMKGESFGTMFNDTSKSICMHCILTPSNCDWFNEYFYDDLDLRIEAEMNNYWNAHGTHPVVYYGGGWNKRKSLTPKGPFIPDIINLVDIDLLEDQLKQFPTMVITPYFDPYLYFRVQLWGMGDLDENLKLKKKLFRIDIPFGDVDASKRIFSCDYNKNKKEELTDDYFNTTMEEFVPYLTCLIGFVADKYFWSIYGESALLPHIFPLIVDKKKVPFENQLSLTYQVRYENELRFYMEQELFDAVKAIELCHSLTTDQSNNIEIIVSKLLLRNGYEYNNKLTLSDNILNSKLYVDDIIVLSKLEEYRYISHVTFDKAMKSIVADDYYYVLNISELFDILSNDYFNYDNFVFVVKDKKVCVGFLTKENHFKRSVVAILDNSNRASNKVYQFNIKEKSCKVALKQFKLFETVPNALFLDSYYNDIKERAAFINKQEKLGKEIHEEDSSLFDDSLKKRVCDNEIKQWVKENIASSSIIKIIRVIYEDWYFILLLSTEADDSVINKMSFKMHSVDKSIDALMNNKLVLTIKK